MVSSFIIELFGAKEALVIFFRVYVISLLLFTGINKFKHVNRHF